MFSKENFGSRIRQLRLARNENQKALADHLGVTVTQVSDMENGKVSTTLEKLVLICEHYQVSSDYLLGLSDEK